MRDGQVIDGRIAMTRGGLTILNYLTGSRGGYLDVSTRTANAYFGFAEPTEVLYFEGAQRPPNGRKQRGDAKFQPPRKITLKPDENFNLFSCFSRQGGAAV